jgi:predicted amidohydrolase YtcJ
MPKADLILLNGKIATMDDKNPWANALVVSGERIIYSGEDDVAKGYITKETEVIDLKGKLTLPGFNDAHLHFLGGGLNFLRVVLKGCKSFQEIERKLKDKLKRLPAGSWILGRGWDHTLFNQGNWPDKSFLDGITPQNPVFLKRVDGHIGWANSLALQLAGVNRDTHSPDGGTVIKDCLTGEPTGILMEKGMDLVEKIIPKPARDELTLAVREAMKEANRYGITSIQDSSDLEVIEVYKKLLEKDELKVRVSEWLPLELIKKHEELKSLIESFSDCGLAGPEKSSYLKSGLLKTMADGTLGSHTAFLFEPYADKPEKSGVFLIPEEELEYMVSQADRSGYQIGIHTIGDRTNHIVLNIYEKINKMNPERKRRNRLEHCSVLRETDISRFAKLGVIASVQPAFWSSDKEWLEQRLGKERLIRAYPFRSLLDSGVNLAFGTDWPVESLNPMTGIYSAVTRDVETHSNASLQKLTVEQAIKAYTLGSTFAEFQEKEKGSLEAGKLADIVVLTEDVFNIYPEDILETEVDMTILGGKIMFRRNDNIQ